MKRGRGISGTSPIHHRTRRARKTPLASNATANSPRAACVFKESAAPRRTRNEKANDTRKIDAMAKKQITSLRIESKIFTIIITAKHFTPFPERDGGNRVFPKTGLFHLMWRIRFASIFIVFDVGVSPSWQGNGLWLRHSLVRVQPPQPLPKRSGGPGTGSPLFRVFGSPKGG